MQGEMEKCPAEMLSFLKCSSMLGRRCLIAQNENVPNGDLSKLAEIYSKKDTQTLRDYLEVHSPGGKWERICVASIFIAPIVRGILIERGEKI